MPDRANIIFCGYDGVNPLNASDESAEQSVSHFHIQIISIKQGDQIDAWTKFEGTKLDINALFTKIRMLKSLFVRRKKPPKRKKSFSVVFLIFRTSAMCVLRKE